MKSEYPCTACRKRGCAASYQRCESWRAWFHDVWSGLEGVEEREKYKAWLELMIQRGTWKEGETE